MNSWTSMWGKSSVSNETKMHHLYHIPFWVKRFGPPIIGTTETNEAGNKKVRQCLQMSNRQAASRDTAFKYAAAAGLRYIAQGGVWRSKSGNMTRAGSSFLEHFQEIENRRLVGLSSPSTAHGDKVYYVVKNKEGRPRILTSRDLTDSWHVRFRTNGSYYQYSRFRVADEYRRHKGSCGSFVRSKSGGLYRVAAILRDMQAKEDPFLIAEDFRQSVVPLTLAPDIEPWISCKRFRRLACKDIQAVLNVQHVCSSGCSSRDVRDAYRVEREAVEGTIWHHSDDGSWVINDYMLSNSM